MSECGCTSGYICNTHRTIRYTAPIGIISGGVVGGHLGSPTPELQILSRVGPPDGALPDLHGEIVKLCFRVKELEKASKFNLDLIENLAKRLNEAEDKLKAIEEQFLHFIELRKIKGTG